MASERDVRPRAGLEIRLVRRVKIGKARDSGLELQFDGSGWTMALLADDDLGLALHPLAFGQGTRVERCSASAMPRYGRGRGRGKGPRKGLIP